MIVDTHVHILCADEAGYPRQLAERGSHWVHDLPTTVEDLLARMDEAGIDRAVLVQPQAVYAFDNACAADSALRHPERCACVCIVDSQDPDGPAQLRQWVRERGVRGLRLFTPTQPEETLVDGPGAVALWDEARALGIPVCAFIRPHQVPNLRRMLDRYPEIPVVLDHLAMPDLEGGPPFAAAAPILDLAAYPNLTVKWSGMTLEAARNARTDPQELLRRVVDRFGPERLIWGSNFPATGGRGVKEHLQEALAATAFLSHRERDLVFGENALRLWPELGRGREAPQ